MQKQEFKTQKPYTKTTILNTNWYLDIKTLFENLPIMDNTIVNNLLTTPYTVDLGITKKKHIQNIRDQIKQHIETYKDGTIITLKYNGNVGGVDVKDVLKNCMKEEDEKKIKNKKKQFRNSMGIVIRVLGKNITVKLPASGKIQMTGIKTDKHSETCIKYIWGHINNLRKIHPNVVKVLGDYMCYLENDEKRFNIGPGHYPRVMSLEVMVNIDFELGFKINRDKLNRFIHYNTEHISIFKPSANTSVNIKILSNQHLRNNFREMEWTPSSKSYEYIGDISYDTHLTKLTKKELKKANENKYHTFLIFHSGKVIQSSPYYKEMEMIYNSFIPFLINNIKEIEENLIFNQ